MVDKNDAPIGCIAIKCLGNHCLCDGCCFNIDSGCPLHSEIACYGLDRKDKEDVIFIKKET